MFKNTVATMLPNSDNMEQSFFKDSESRLPQPASESISQLELEC